MLNARLSSAAEGVPEIQVSVHPLKMILAPLAGDDFKISELMNPGASPHTFEPKPSDLQKAQAAVALFYIGPGLDLWATRCSTKNRIEVLPLVPKELVRTFVDEDESPLPTQDPHFWTDPLTVKGVVPALAEKLCALSSRACPRVQVRAKSFLLELDRLAALAQTQLSKDHDRSVILFHPSFLYLMSRVKLPLAGVIELSPGKEPSPQELKRLIERARKLNGKVVFSEPQFSSRPAQVLSEALGIRTGILEPYGATAEVGYTSYFESNLEAFRKGLE